MITKVCSQCSLDKELTCFSPNGNRLRSNCKQCQAQKRAKFVSLNKEKILAQNRLSYSKRRISILDKKKTYHRLNKIFILRKHKLYYSANKAMILLRIKQYRRLNPEVYRASNAKRRARLYTNQISVSTLDIQRLKREYNYCCAYCKAPNSKDNPLQIDHKIPLSKGGTHSLRNLIPACRACNLSKFVTDWDVWCERIGFVENEINCSDW